MRSPYACITGFDFPAQILQLDHFFYGKPSHYRIVCGILVSHKTFLGNSKSRMPSLHSIVEMAEYIRKKNFLVAIHYCPKDNPEIAFEDVEEICSLVSPEIVQINSSIPEVIESVVKAFGDKRPEIVFQMNSAIVDRFGTNTAVMEYFKKIGGNDGSNHCLYDMSAGQGIGIRKDGIVWDGQLYLHNELSGLIGKHGLVPGIAGGLNAENVIACISEFGKSISIDAETGVRDESDLLVIEKVNNFFNNACNKICEG